MTTATHTYNIATLDNEDRMAVEYICFLENQRITQENQRRAQQSPPLDPLPLIGSTVNEKKIAYESYMRDKCGRMHLQWLAMAKEAKAQQANIRDIRDKLPTATDQQLTQIAAILT